ncbi:MAG: hypothetical protein CML66_29630 [Rhodobacteraceae bacterium]|nr:hypothetical protein [Paracoccaceae bacterium]MAY47752.1 hypothetical protein [Paracoccaceae bacterium]|tara:strand:- start:153 stop:710 length:558 start_codon:yes stop_codon:yes gene_type:complete
MSPIQTLHTAVLGRLDIAGDVLLPLLARFVFAAVLLVYFWRSALTKLGDGVLGVFHPSVGAYAQMFPKQMEAASYDITQLSPLYGLVAVIGTWAEFLLPLAIVIGLCTRLAALGMIGFVTVQSLTDVYGHGSTDAQTLGAWFDAASGSLIMDQRTLWMFVLLTLVFKGAGALSLDALLRRALSLR